MSSRLYPSALTVFAVFGAFSVLLDCSGLVNFFWGLTMEVPWEESLFRLWDSRSLELATRFPRVNNIHLHCEWVPDGNQVITSCNGFNGDGCEITVSSSFLKYNLTFRYGTFEPARSSETSGDTRGPSPGLATLLNMDCRTKNFWLAVHWIRLSRFGILRMGVSGRETGLMNVPIVGVLWTEELVYGAELLQIAVVGDYR